MGPLTPKQQTKYGPRNLIHRQSITQNNINIITTALHTQTTIITEITTTQTHTDDNTTPSTKTTTPNMTETAITSTIKTES